MTRFRPALSVVLLWSAFWVRLDAGLVFWAMACRVVNLRRAPYDVYIGRAGRGQDGYFGSPFRIGPDGSREEVIAKFRTWFLERIDRDPAYRGRVLALKDKVLGCFCVPAACHGTVLVEWVNEHA